MKASLKFVKKYYTDDLAERNSKESKWAHKWAREVRGSRVLNIGCGPQFFDDALLFGKVPQELIGIDLNPTNIQFLKTSRHPEMARSKRFLKTHGVRVDVFVHNLKKERPRFRDHFEAIYASGVLGMFTEKDTKQILKLLAGYLKPHGRLVMVSWTDDRLSLEKLRERRKYGWYWRKGPAVRGMGVLIKRAGFKVIKSGVHRVEDPEKYEWGIIYGYVAEKEGI